MTKETPPETTPQAPQTAQAVPRRRGGLTFPANPAEALRGDQPEPSASRRLQDLQIEQIGTPPGSPPLAAQVSSDATAQLRNGADEQISKSASAQMINVPTALKPLPGETIEVQVRAALEQHRERQHPGGTKASVEMSPELQKKIKRYLLEHGEGASIRQFFVELATAFLEKEGY